MPKVDRSSVQLAVKIGMDTRCPIEKTGQYWNMRGDYDNLLMDVNYSLNALNTDYLDVIVLNRVDPRVPIEESAAALKRLVDEGKAKYIGLCEVTGDMIRRY